MPNQRGSFWKKQFHICFVRSRACLLLLAMGLLLGACSGNALQEPEGNAVIYCISPKGTSLETHPVTLQSTDSEGMLEELIQAMSQVPELPAQYKVPLAMNFSLVSYTLNEEGWLNINFDDGYRTLDPSLEVLVRAAIVQTLCQDPGVSFVSFNVDGDILYDNAGEQVGWMNADTFIYNDGNQINTIEEVHLTLYFANEEGTGLITTTRDKFYSTNTPLERLVVEEMITGPVGTVSDIYPTINSYTKINNVSTKDGICYVNLDDTFLTVSRNVPTELAIYSLVNSLCSLNSVNKVQILISGEVPGNFETYYERNLDLVVR